MFRPCIDLHEGRVKQIVGGTLESGALKTNFVSDKGAAWYASLFRRDALTGGHVIMLGPGNEVAAREALEAYPQGLQIGGGIHDGNAKDWIEAGASHVILTSWLFHAGDLSLERVERIKNLIGVSRFVIDLSCKKIGNEYWVATNRWQTVTKMVLNESLITRLEPYCDEFLIHAVDVEGKCQGIDLELVQSLSCWGSKPITYAGGAKSMKDLQSVHSAGGGRIHLTIGSALDIFGGNGVAYTEALAFNQKKGQD